MLIFRPWLANIMKYSHCHNSLTNLGQHVAFLGNGSAQSASRHLPASDAAQRRALPPSEPTPLEPACRPVRNVSAQSASRHPPTAPPTSIPCPAPPRTSTLVLKISLFLCSDKTFREAPYLKALRLDATSASMTKDVPKPPRSAAQKPSKLILLNHPKAPRQWRDHTTDHFSRSVIPNMSDFVGMLMPSHSLQPRLGLLAMKLTKNEMCLTVRRTSPSRNLC